MDDLHLDTHISRFWYYFITAHSNCVKKRSAPYIHCVQ